MPNLSKCPSYVTHCRGYMAPELKYLLGLTLYPIETPFNTFAKRADPDQAALGRAA